MKLAKQDPTGFEYENIVGREKPIVQRKVMDLSERFFFILSGRILFAALLEICLRTNINVKSISQGKGFAFNLYGDGENICFNVY